MHQLLKVLLFLSTKSLENVIMLELQITNTTDYKLLIDRIEQILIPSKITITAEATTPVLLDSDKSVEGTSAIHNYLDELESFSKQWYACRCDMFP